MKKTAIALLSVASFFCGYAHAEVDDPDSYCQTHNGYVLVEDERGNPMCVHRDVLDAQMEEEAPSGQSQTCSSEFKNGIGDAGSQCESAYQTQQQQCKKSAYNKGGEIQKLETEFNAYLRKKAEDIKAGKSEYQTSCRKIEETHKKLA
ncbi:MAG TPA: hypothetical protein PL182_11140, partial [Pseudobdellovibrionaceae bacterium]|nr:hypothetical protein [Pseudobdellovibrionaceae bacterium]